ncbi:MAG: tRNA threonylcarbamoyladenosine dehydratase [Eubacteriales bacterium]|nr:tRNA threonylcarbamoyladenosine dehydratase [Eubacteriales bacterium]
MEEQFSRTELLLGKAAMEKLTHSHVAVFGIGGVGGYVVEALVRSGVGAIDLIDHDQVSLSNLNRQIIATRDTVGRNKTAVMRERILSINPDCRVEVHDCFYLPETREEFDFASYDYVVDAIDTVTGKLQLVVQAQEMDIPIISSMGAGNKLNPAEFQVADIYETSVCPLAKVMRKELKKRGVKHLKVVYSKEKPLSPGGDEETESAGVVTRRKVTPGSVAFVPSVVGLIIASEVIKDLTADARAANGMSESGSYTAIKEDGGDE